MRLLRHSEIPGDRVLRSYRNCSWRGLAGGTALTAAITAAALSFRAGTPYMVLALVPGVLTAVLLYLLLDRVRWSFRPRNWLLKETERGLLIQLRSYLSAYLPEHGPTVLQLDADEIVAVVPVREQLELPAMRGATVHHYRYIDLVLASRVPLKEVAEALRAERRGNHASRPVPLRHFDFPVHVVPPETLRLRWEWIKPNERAALSQLGARWPLLPEGNLRRKPWADMDAGERDAFIAELWERGDLHEAHQLMRLHHEVDGQEAWRRLFDLARDA